MATVKTCDKCGSKNKVEYSVIIKDSTNQENIFTDVCSECVKKIEKIGVPVKRPRKAKKEVVS